MELQKLGLKGGRLEGPAVDVLDDGEKFHIGVLIQSIQMEQGAAALPQSQPS
nr:hypothetical protein [Bacillus norwichensis]